MIIIPLGDDVEKKYFPVLTIFLIAASVIAFIYEARLVNESLNDHAIMQFMSEWGLVPKDFAEGKIIGLVTHMFLHADLFHLLGNMLVFWAFARTLEDVLGTALFGVLYMISGIAGGFAHAVFNTGADIPLIGASGAIAGVIGAYCLGFGVATNIRTFVWFIRPFRINVPTSVYAILWLVMQSLGAFTSEEGAGIAWMAHLGGFVAGSVVMIAFQQLSGRRLVEGRDGSLQIADVAIQEAYLNQNDAADGLELDGLSCNYCHTPLDDEHQIADNLWRCPNPTCKQLHIETQPLAPMIQ